MILIDKLFQIDAFRSKAVADSQTYESISARHSELGISEQARSVADKMPLFTLQASEKIAGKHIEIARTSAHTSIYAKLTENDKELKVEESIKFAKTQRKDSMRDPNLRAILTYGGRYRLFGVF